MTIETGFLRVIDNPLSGVRFESFKPPAAGTGEQPGVLLHDSDDLACKKKGHPL